MTGKEGKAGRAGNTRDTGKAGKAAKIGKAAKVGKAKRLDQWLIEAGFFETTDEALRAILAREVKVGDDYASSPAQLISSDAAVFVKQPKRFVSRGGEKLQGALEAFQVDVSGLRCLDAGASTGGFADCLLQAGAAEVSCVDVNYGQLAWSIRNNPRVRVFERTNIRNANPDSLGAPFDLITADLSFIGLAGLAPVFARLSHPGTIFIGLIKPQFESMPGESDHGVVRDENVRQRVIDEVSEALALSGFRVDGVVTSRLKGPAGNIEYLAKAVYRDTRS